MKEEFNEPKFKEYTDSTIFENVKMVYTAIPNKVANVLYTRSNGRGLLSTYHLLASHYSPDSIYTGVFRSYENLVIGFPVKDRQLKYDVQELCRLFDEDGIPIAIKNTVQKSEEKRNKYIHLPHIAIFLKQQEYIRKGLPALEGRLKAIDNLNLYCKLNLPGNLGFV